MTRAEIIRMMLLAWALVMTVGFAAGQGWLK